jgi:hicA protein
MNSKQQKIYDAIFKNPVQSNIEWQDIESLLKSLGASISEGNGSRVRIELNGERAVFHRPHPESVTDKGAVKSMRRFLENAGVKNDDL